MSDQPTLFLEFYGVLHANKVNLDRRTGELVMANEFGTLFQWAPICDTILRRYPTVEVVLSTILASHFGLDVARLCLPPEIASRVVDSIWSKDEWIQHSINNLCLYKQIEQYVRRRDLTNWLAIGCDARCWPKEHAFRLIKTEDMTGISTEHSQRELDKKLAMIVTSVTSTASPISGSATTNIS